MFLSKKALGNKGEELAETFLKKQGYRILDKNYRTRWGEIDILAQDKEEIVLVEVKTKTNSQFGEPVEEIDYFKRKKLCQLAQAISQKHPESNIRIDVVGIKMEQKPQIELIKNALECEK